MCILMRRVISGSASSAAGLSQGRAAKVPAGIVTDFRKMALVPPFGTNARPGPTSGKSYRPRERSHAPNRRRN